MYGSYLPYIKVVINMTKSLKISDRCAERLNGYKCCGASYSDVIEMLMTKTPDCNVVLTKLAEQQKMRDNK